MGPSDRLPLDRHRLRRRLQAAGLQGRQVTPEKPENQPPGSSLQGLRLLDDDTDDVDDDDDDWTL